MSTETTLSENTLERILLERGALTPDQLQDAQLDAESSGSRLERYLVDNGIVSGTDMALALSQYLNVPPIELSHFTPSSELTELVPKEMLRRHNTLPVARVGNLLTVAVGDPFDVMAIEEVQARTGLQRQTAPPAQPISAPASPSIR